MHTSITRRYFAASNSSRGFCNYYGECFSEARVDHLYVIKGGPGTGKSHFMRAVARYAHERGYAVTEYACSSDPASLDGVLLTCSGKSAIGLLDGTAPHVYEPTSPGVREEIVNLGVFWNSTRLAGEKSMIRALSAQKTEAYARAYACLRAAGEMDRVADSLITPTVKEDRLVAMARRILRHVTPAGRFETSPALRSAWGMTGRVTHHTYEQDADSLLILDASYGLGYRVTSHLLHLSAERGDRVLVSYHPAYPDKVDGLLYPDSGMCVLVGDAEPPEDDRSVRTVSLRRYTDTEALRQARGEIRHALAIRNTLEEDALRALSHAGKYHFELERIYAAAMDFAAKEAFTEQFCQHFI